MKHAMIAGLSVLCLSVAAQAANAFTIPDAKALFLQAKSVKGYTAATPVAQRKVRAHILKSTFVKDPNGYHFEDVTVCDQRATMNVFDGRNGPFEMGNNDFDLIKCDSAIGGAPTTLHIGGFSNWFNNPIFPGEPSTDLSVTFAALYSEVVPGGNSAAWMDSSAYSRELNPRSTILVLRPQVLMLCKGPTETRPIPKASSSGSSSSQSQGDCTPSIPEFFYAIVEIES